MTRLLIADEHPLIRAGLKSLLADAPDFLLTGEVDTIPALLEAVPHHKPDLVLLDMCVKRHRVAEAVNALRRDHPRLRFLILTNFRGTDEVLMALQAKMHGFVLKTDTTEQLLDALRTVAQGRRWFSPTLSRELEISGGEPTLTEREREVLGAIALGKSNGEVADTLFISEGTVKFHATNIFAKLGDADRTDAVVIGLSRGILRLPEK
jgi:DNA-binding NarL/FixJ family response regulator